MSWPKGLSDGAKSRRRLGPRDVKLKLLQLAVAVAVVAFVVVRSHPSDLWRVLEDVDPALALAAVALNVPVMLLTPLRSSFVFRRLGYEVPSGVLIPTTILGFVAGGLTPAASGELLRAQTLRSRAGVPMNDGVVAVVYERVLSLYILVVTTLLLFGARSLSTALTVLVALAALVLVFAPSVVARVTRGILSGLGGADDPASDSRGWRRIAGVLTPLRHLLMEAGLLAMWSGVSVAMFALLATQYWLLARGVGGGVSFGEAWIGLGVSTAAGIAVLIPFGLGVLDGSLAATLERFGMTLEQGGVVALLVRATVTLPLVLAAFACYLYLQRSAPAQSSSPAASPEKPLPG